jgi:hypothetical protein
MKRKFIGSYLLIVLIMLCTYVPFNLMKLSKGSLIFVRKFGYAPVWYSYTESSYITVIDYKQLVIQIGLTAMTFAIIYLFLPNKISK